MDVYNSQPGKHVAHERFESYRKIYQETVAMDYRVGIREKKY
nr:13658_t:CDS:2 [Entrophospora candida]